MRLMLAFLLISGNLAAVAVYRGDLPDALQPWRGNDSLASTSMPPLGVPGLTSEDLLEMELGELAAFITGLDAAAAQALTRQFDALDHLPPTYRLVATAALLGAAEAKIRQALALQDLDGVQRAALMDGSTEDFDALAAALQGLDHQQLAQALGALQVASAKILAILEHRDSMGPGFADVLSERLGSSPVAPPPPGDLLVALAALTGGVDAQVADELQGLPAEVQSGLAGILEAALKIDAQSFDSHVAVAAAVDAARPSLEMWATLTLVQKQFGVQPLPRLPDPDAGAPPKQWNLPRGIPPEPVDLALGMARLSKQLGIPFDAGAAQSLEAIPPHEAAHIGSLLQAVLEYLVAAQAAADAPPVTWSYSQVLEFLGHFQAGTIPAPGSYEAIQLLAALPSLEAEEQRRHALANLMSAIEEAVPSLTLPVSSSQSSLPGPLCDAAPCDEASDAISAVEKAVAEADREAASSLEPSALAAPACEGPDAPSAILLAPLLALDLCGVDSDWSVDVLLSIDVGGNDTYTHRAGAPFTPAPVGGIQPPAIPMSIVLDLGGSDTYDSGGRPCSQGAACHNDTGVQPVAVLIDWDNDHAKAENRFLAGARSQGHGGYGILIERVGRHAELSSTYAAGSASQGVAAAGGIRTETAEWTGTNERQQAQANATRAAPVGALVRLMGSGSTASSTFQAGDKSQAYAQAISRVTIAPATALFFNIVGESGASDDAYAAGSNSQASAAQAHGANAFFADVAGPGSTSNDQYVAGEGSRGSTGSEDVPRALTGTYESFTAVAPLRQHVVFLDALVPALGLPSEPGQGAIEAGDGKVVVDGGMRLTYEGSSDDVYRGHWEQGHGWSRGLFVDLGGQDDYDPQGPAGTLNDATWNNRTEPEGVMQSADSPCLQPPGVPACGYDLGVADRDGDGMPAFLEILWGDFVGLWDANDADPGRTPLPVAPAVLIDTTGGGLTPEDLNRTYAVVLSLGNANEHYSANFSAAIHIDSGGNDRYDGAAGAAGMTIDGEPLGHAQHPFSLLVDLGGDDVYAAKDKRVQGYGGGGSTGMLLDARGADKYLAQSHAQGVGEMGGIGILIDLASPANNDYNLFRAASPSKGASAGTPGGAGILIANGAHNTFHNDGTPAGARAGPGGISMNLGDNGGPVIPTQEPVADPNGLEVDVDYPFRATVQEPEGDDVVVCWSMQFWNKSGEPGLDWHTTCDERHGRGQPETFDVESSFRWNDTFQVPTDASDAEIDESYPFLVRLAVTDSGNVTTIRTWDVRVANDPPDVRAPDPPVEVTRGTSVAVQPLLEPAPDLDEMIARLLVDGEESTTLGCWDPSAPAVQCIDWATAAWGASLRLPESSKTILQDHERNLPIDGEATTAPVRLPFHANSGAAHAIIDLGHARAIHTLQLVAGHSSIIDVVLSLEGIRPDGTTAFFGTVTVPAHHSEITLNLPDQDRLQPYKRIVLRQLVDTLPDDVENLHLYEVRALGPGFSRTWERSVTVTYEVIDAFGGRAATTFNVDVAVSSEDEDPAPAELLDFARRGPVGHASVAYAPGAAQEYSLLIDSAASGDDRVCIDWGDGSDPDCQDGGPDVLYAHAWDLPDPPEPTAYSVRAFVEDDPDNAHHLLWVHVEEALDVWLEAHPIMFLALGPGATTWHLPFIEPQAAAEGAGYAIVVDADGDDRYIDKAAATRAPLAVTGRNNGGVPALLVDAAGNDDYISSGGRTQGFASYASAALLVDADGDDLYIAKEESQGVGLRGAAMLLDLGGDDVFFGGPPDALGAETLLPDAAAHSSEVPRTTQAVVHRPPLEGVSSTFMQGASEEGIGILAATGGFDLFMAGSKGQGYGQHDPRVQLPIGYGSPNPECTPPMPVGPEPGGCEGMPGGCEAGGTDTTDNTFCFIGASPDTCSLTLPAFCDWGISTMPTQGPRYGPSIGLLLRSDGPSIYSLSGLGQGASGADARGALIDQGGFNAYADSNAQAFTAGGLATFIGTGAHAAWLGERGHGFAETADVDPEGVPAEAAAYMGTPASGGCTASCPGPVPLGESRGPTLQWSPSPPAEEHGKRIDLAIRVPAGGPYELIAFSQPLVPSEPTGTGCSGQLMPMAPPARIKHERDFDAPAVSTWMFSVEHERLDDGPRYVAGCHAITVFAREAGDEDPGAWSGLEGRILLLPPPVPRLKESGDDPTIFIGTEPITATLVFDEPLLLHRDPPAIAFALQGSPAQGFQARTISWDGLELEIEITPPTVQGFRAFTLCAITAWKDDPTSCEKIADLAVDTGEPDLSLESLVAPGGWWKATRALDVKVTAESNTPVTDVWIRVVRDDCEADCEITLHSVPVGREELALSLIAQEAASTTWAGSLLSADENFHGGPVIVEARATRGATAGQWTEVLRFGLDKAFPTYVRHESSVGTDATNEGYPIGFTVVYEDCGNNAQGGDACEPGAGLEQATAVAFMRPKGTTTLIPLALAPADADDAVSFVWDGDCEPEQTCEPPEGRYEVLLQAEDKAGNLLVKNPGVPFTIDRTEPRLSRTHADAEAVPHITLPVLATPEGEPPVRQERVKPGDVIDVSIVALDLGTAPSGVHQVTASFEGFEEEWTLIPVGNDGVYAHDGVTVPEDVMDDLVLTITAIDAAGNEATASSTAIPVQPEPPVLEPATVTARGRSLRVVVESSHETEIVEATVQAGPTKLAGIAQQLDPTTHQVDFIDLAPQAAHSIKIVLRDPAGWVVEMVLPQEFTTADIATEIVPGFIAPLTYSGDVDLTGRILQMPSTGGVLRLMLEGAADPLAELPMAPLAGETASDFHFPIESATAFPDTLEAAANVRLILEFDDGIDSVSTDVAMRIDNAPPKAEPIVHGTLHNGWYNHSVVIDAGSSDDTVPLSHEALVGDSTLRQRSIRLSEDGIHAVSFTLADAAVPPNTMQTAPLEIRIDRTPPELSVEVAQAATRNLRVPIVVEAEDPDSGSGLADFRVGTDAWSEWDAAVPEHATLGDGPDGQRWIRVAVRDEAGNVRQSSHAVVLDRAPPEILALSWIGRDASDVPVLRLVADDVTSRVVDVRFAKTGGWTAWQATDGLDALPLPAGALADGKIEVRDAAGNVAAAELPGLGEPAPEATTVAGPLLTQVDVAPKQGDLGTRFAFTALVGERGGQAPSEVWLEIGELRIRMDPVGAPVGAAQMYAASTRLPATQFAEPHQYRITAIYGAVEESSATEAGPLVSASGDALLGTPPSTKKSPVPLPVLAVAIALAMQLTRRRHT